MLLTRKWRRFLNTHDAVEIARERQIFYTYKTYAALVLIRFFIIFLPAIGHVHPDEYTDMLEVVAGKILDVEHATPRQYDHLNPTRSLAIPFLVFGPALFTLRFIDYTARYFFAVSITCPYAIILTVRIVLFLISLIVDYYIYAMCKLYYRPFLNKLIIYAASHMTLVYGTRALTGAFELAIFAALCYYTSKSLLAYEKVMNSKQLFLENVKNSVSPVEVKRVKYNKIVKCLRELNLHHVTEITCLIVLGASVRPAFLVYCAIPVFFWIHRGLSSSLAENHSWLDVHVRMLVLITLSATLAAIFITFDSFYYGYLTVAEIINNDVHIDNFVCVHANYARRLTTTENVVSNLIAELIVEFNVLFLVAVVMIASMVYRLSKRGRFTGYDRTMHLDNFLLLSALIPLAILAVFPQLNELNITHALTFPLVILYGDYVIKPDRLFKAIECDWIAAIDTKLLFRIFLSTTLFTSVFLNIFNQSGVFQATVHLSRYNRAQVTRVVVVGTYDLPRFLLSIPDRARLYRSKEGYLYRRRPFLHVTHVHAEHARDTLREIMTENAGQDRVQLLMTGVRANDFIAHVNNSANDLRVRLRKSFIHIHADGVWAWFRSRFVGFFDFFTLNLYDVEF